MVDIVDGLRVPSIVIAHTIPKDPTSHQRSVLEAIAATADRVVVMSEAAQQRLCLTYAVDRRKVTTIPHGATVPSIPRVKRPSRPTILTLGLLRPGKGIERVIDAMPSLNDAPGRPRYLVAGPTHPKVLAADGEAYRDARIEQARRNGVADSVKFDPGYYDGSMLTALIQQSSVVVLPYDSTEQVTSGVLVDAIANGRPVVATAFPHAVELLNSGAGIVVDHDDPAALASALRQVVTQPRLAGSMAAEARRRAPEMAWPVVANAYLGLAHRVLAERRSTGVTATMPRPNFDHLLGLTDRRGTFEHARHGEPSQDVGYRTDDVARALVVATREPGPDTTLNGLAAVSLRFLGDAQALSGACYTRMDSAGRWPGEPALDDCWGLCIWALGTTVLHSNVAWARQTAIVQFERAAQERSPWPRAMAYAALGAADVLAYDPEPPRLASSFPTTPPRSRYLPATPPGRGPNRVSPTPTPSSPRR